MLFGKRRVQPRLTCSSYVEGCITKIFQYRVVPTPGAGRPEVCMLLHERFGFHY